MEKTAFRLFAIMLISALLNILPWRRADSPTFFPESQQQLHSDREYQSAAHDGNGCLL